MENVAIDEDTSIYRDITALCLKIKRERKHKNN